MTCSGSCRSTSARCGSLERRTWLLQSGSRAALADLVNSIRNYPSAADLATISVPVVCSYGERSPVFMRPLVTSLAAAIPAATTREIAGAAHAVAFDAPEMFVRLIADAVAGVPRRSAVRA